MNLPEQGLREAEIHVAAEKVFFPSSLLFSLPSFPLHFMLLNLYCFHIPDSSPFFSSFQFQHCGIS